MWGEVATAESTAVHEKTDQHGDLEHNWPKTRRPKYENILKLRCNG